jgi:hypothetical protein
MDNEQNQSERERGRQVSEWTVWVGGGEVTSYYLMSRTEAEEIADYYLKEGFDDVVVEEVVNA